MIVFEPELWGVSPLVPAGKTPTKGIGSGPADAKGPSATAAKPTDAKSGLKLWDGGSFDFHDILDVINPLQHLPVISTIYRAEAGDEIGAVPRILGSMLFGGGPVGALIGAASALFNIVVEHETGKDLGSHIYTAIFGDKSTKPRTTQIAASKTATSAATTVAAAAATGKAAGQSAAAQAAATKARKIEPRTHAALQAFVAGLAKNSPGIAAAAAKSATAQSTVRVKGAGGSVAPKGEVSTQFRRSTWYQRNQAVLRAQAQALANANAKRAAAAKSAAKPKDGAAATGATGAPAILHLFTQAGAAKSSAAKPASKAAASAAAARQRAVPGPWVAGEMANGLAKYEALIKARKAAGQTVNQKN